MTNDRETENARERLAVRLRETLGAAVREIRPSSQDGIALNVFAGSLPDVAAAAPKLKGAGFWPLPNSQGGRTLFLAGAHSADGRDALPYLIAVFPAGSAAPQESAGLDAARAAAAAMRENGVKDGAFALLRRKALADYYLGRTVEIAIDRPIGYVHAKKTYTLTYPLNYGYLPGVIGGDGEELDVYLMGVETPVSSYTARIIGVVHRENDEEDKLVAAPEGRVFHQGEIAAAVEFQEKYYKTRVEPLYPKSCGALVYRETEAGRAYLCLLQRRSGTYRAIWRRSRPRRRRPAARCLRKPGWTSLCGRISAPRSATTCPAASGSDSRSSSPRAGVSRGRTRGNACPAYGWTRVRRVNASPPGTARRSNARNGCCKTAE